MAPAIKVALLMMAGAVLGLLLALLFVVVFVDMDMVLPIYVAGLALGAVSGVAYGVLSLRRHRAPSA
jgi:high-affinity Fe2+/Pb2+ permease